MTPHTPANPEQGGASITTNAPAGVMAKVIRCAELVDVEETALARVRIAQADAEAAGAEFMQLRRELMDTPGGFDALREMLARRQRGTRVQ